LWWVITVEPVLKGTYIEDRLKFYEQVSLYTSPPF